jgi:hypothetical protein
MIKNIFVAVSLALLSSATQAQVKDKEFKAWTVYSTTLEDRKLCYIFASPEKKTGNTTKRGAPYFIVTNISDTIDEVSNSAGYPYKAHSKVTVTFDNQKTYAMSQIKGEIAWIQDEKIEREFVGVLKKQNWIDVKGISTKGTYSVDRYSLLGFSDAYGRMKSLCK